MKAMSDAVDEGRRGGMPSSAAALALAAASAHDERHARSSIDQLDLFADSRDVMLRNDLAAALLRGDVEGARDVCAELAVDFGGDPLLEPAALLIEHLDRQRTTDPAASFDAARIDIARDELEQRLAPAARDVLGANDADAWLTAQWRRLAHHAAAVAWHPDRADAHAASLYVQARAWADVDATVQRIESWRRIPQPLLWMVLARWHAQGPDAAWPLLVESLWLAPQRAHAVIADLPDAGIQKLCRRFDECFEPAAPHDWAWLPAFVLVEQPLLAAVLRSAQADADSAPARAFQLMQALLRLERQGRHHDLIEHRRQLQALSEPLFVAYMRTR